MSGTSRRRGSRWRTSERCEGDGAYVLYWMTAARRTTHSFALERALDWARERQAARRARVAARGISVGERSLPRLRHGRHARQRRCAREGGRALLSVRRAASGRREGLARGARSGRVRRRHRRGAVLLLRRMLAAAAPRLPVRLEAIDGNGLVPLRAITQGFTFAHQFRRFVQKIIRPHLVRMPHASPLARRASARREAADRDHDALAARRSLRPRRLCASLPIDHRVPIVEDRGGHVFAKKRLDAFVRKRLSTIPSAVIPTMRASSGLSFHLHFGHVSAHESFSRRSPRAPTGRSRRWRARPTAGATASGT